MRRALLFVIVGVAGLYVLPGAFAQNAQKVYPLRSAEYEALRTLYIQQGIALPFSSGPFSEAEIRLAMDRLDTSRFSPAGDTLFNWLRQRLLVQSAAAPNARAARPLYSEEDGRLILDIGAEVSVESYLHTDSDNRYWDYRWEDRKPFLRFPMEGWVGNHAYATVDLAFLKNIPDFSVYSTYSQDGRYRFDQDGDYGLQTREEDPWTNWPVIPETLDIQFPHRAFIAVGGDRWNASLGRDTIDWGNGRTGNLYISDYVDWYDSLQFSTFWDNFKFSWMWNSLDGTLIPGEREFEEQLVGWDTDSDGRVDTYSRPGDDSTPVYAYDPGEEHKNLLAQRFEVRLWDRVGFAYTMGLIYGRERVELRHINPVYDYHNLYTNTRWVGNAHRSFEIDVAAAPGVSVYGVFAPDQWTSPLESETNIKEEPNAFVAMGGIDTRFALGEGFLETTLEGVYATPWMHIHNNPLTSITARRYVIAHHSEGKRQLWYDKPIGHYGGNDFSLLWVDSSYGVAGRYRYGITGSWEGDGSVPITALLESRFDTDLRGELDEDDAQLTAPSSGYEVDGRERVAMWTNTVALYGEIFPRGIGNLNAIDAGNVAGPTGPGRSPGWTLSIASRLTAQWMKNRHNIPSPWEFDLQWVLSTTIGW